MTEAFAKINPTDPLMLGKEPARRKRNWPELSGRKKAHVIFQNTYESE
jgi:hypothetical protein